MRDLRSLALILVYCLLPLVISGQEPPTTLPGTQPLSADQPLDVLMVDGIDRFCLKELESARSQRESRWNRDYSGFEAYEKSLLPYREKFRTIIGAVDVYTGPTASIGDSDGLAGWGGTNLDESDPPPAKPKYTVVPYRWPVLQGMTAEGLVLVPENIGSRRLAIFVPDSRWSLDQFMGDGLDWFGKKNRAAAPSPIPQVLVENGFLVVIPARINRDDSFAGNPEVAMTNQTNREWVYRSAFEMGRHVIGYEVQKILAAVNFLSDEASRYKGGPLPICIAGVGDGAQLALYSAALDNRISSVLVSGYFQPRENVWQEPIDNNVWRLLTEFGDAEIAGMIAPRRLVIEACEVPETDGPLPVKPGRRGGAAPGKIKTANLSAVQSEFQRAKSLYEKLHVGDEIKLILSGPDGHGANGTESALTALVKGAGWVQPEVFPDKAFRATPTGESVRFIGDDKIAEEVIRQREAIQQRQVTEAVEFTQRLLRRSYKTRDQLFSQADRSSVEKWVASAEKLREYVYQELIGKLPDPTMPLNPRTRKILDEKEFTGYEVVLDTYPDVIAAGILLLPKGMKSDEKRPVVVCQHGLEGVPMDTISGPPADGYQYYKSFAAELAKRGFVTYSPQNPYRGHDRFRTLQRKSNPLGRSLFSYIIPQHQVTLKWLASLPNVDGHRLAFYGLSYGGKTAVRVPPMLPPREGQPGYCLSICSADFNEWVAKNANTDEPFTYVFTPEYEIFEWNMGHVANYAELSMLMTPRPFMVERGHDDQVGIDEWVAWEYAKVRRHYNKLGLGDKTEIEFFNGPHTINGKGTFEFLHRHLNYPPDRP